MEKEQFTVANVKCGGCVKNIQNGIGPMAGVASVSVDIASRQVVVSGAALDRAAIAAKLAALGYPEVGG
jgi:copper chaperone CopZ